MRHTAIAATLAAFVCAGAAAQTAPPGGGAGNTTMQPSSTAPVVPLPGINPPADATGTPVSNAANAPVVTPAPNPNAGLATGGPAKGANSFSKGQARTRIVRHGFSDVAALAKDRNGVWRGTALRDGHRVHVWLDYKGNVGLQ